jgi:hypothetical protein
MEILEKGERAAWVVAGGIRLTIITDKPGKVSA